MNIFHSRFIPFKLKIFGETVTTLVFCYFAVQMYRYFAIGSLHHASFLESICESEFLSFAWLMLLTVEYVVQV